MTVEVSDSSVKWQWNQVAVLFSGSGMNRQCGEQAVELSGSEVKSSDGEG